MAHFKDDDEIINLISECKIEQVSFLSQIIDLSESKIKEMLKCGDWGQKLFLCGWSGITDEMASSLLIEADWSFDEMIAMNPKTSNLILLKIAESKQKDRFFSRRIAEALISNTNVSDEVLGILLINKDVKEKVIAHDNISSGILTRLSNSKDNDIARLVASNINTTSRVLKKLSNHKDPYVRAAVAQNRNTQVEVLETLLNDESSHVKEAALKNAHFKIKEDDAEQIQNVTKNNIVLTQKELDGLFAPDVKIINFKGDKRSYFDDDEDKGYSVFLEGYETSCNIIHPIIFHKIINSNDRDNVINMLQVLISNKGEITYDDVEVSLTNIEYIEFYKDIPKFVLHNQYGERIYYTRETWQEYANMFAQKYGIPNQGYPLFVQTLNDTDYFLTICILCNNNLQLGVWFDETFSEYEYVAQCTCGETNYGFTSYFS